MHTVNPVVQSIHEPSALAKVYMQSIDEIAPELREQRKVNDELGKLSDKTVELLNAAGLFSAVHPEEFGGSGLSALDSLRVYEHLATIDVSSAWVAEAPGIHAPMLQFLDPEGIAEITQIGAPLIAGHFAPLGKAERVEGGYRVTGHWSYGSGIHHISWLMSLAVVTEGGESVIGDNGQPEMVIFCTEVENATLAGNWDVIGLRATGSLDYVIEDVFVPDHRAFSAAAVFTPAAPGSEPWVLTGQVAWAIVFHCSMALGAGRHLLDETGKFARQKSSRGTRLADDERFRREYGKREAQYRSARAYMYDAWERVQAEVNASQPTSRESMTDVKAASTYLHELNIEIGTWAFAELGGTALRGGDFQRSYTNILAMGQHHQATRNLYATCARDFLGEADGRTWAFYELL